MIRATLPSAAGPIMWAALAVPAFAQDGDAEATRSLERRTQEIKEAATPAVVSVTVTTRANPLPRLAFPGLVIAPISQAAERVEGTGFFLASRGLLVTTMDLVFDAERIEVRFSDGTVRDATLLGTDLPYRMAVLRTTPPEGVDGLRHSERVEASPSTIGWFLGAGGSAEPSVRSAPSVDVQVASVRPAPEQGSAYDRFLYAPMSLARGAAGGPLMGADGCVLGMAVGSLVARDSGAAPNARMRFPRAALFVRGDDIIDAVRQIALTGHVERPMIGAMMDGESNRIETLLPGSPAEAAGLADGDAIVKVGCLPVNNFADITRALLRRRAGDPVKLTVDREGEQITRVVSLVPFAAPPAPTVAPIPGATIEAAADADGFSVFTIVEVAGDTLASRAGLRLGDRLLTIDGRPAWRFLQRHRARPGLVAPSRIGIARGDERIELTLPVE